MPRQHLVKHDTKRPDISALIDRLAARLLRTHVRGCPHDHAHLRGGGGQRRGLTRITFRSWIQCLGQPEVQHLHRPVVAYLDVGRFQIAVDDACFMRGFESFGDLLGDGERLVEWDQPLLDPIRERWPFNKFEDERPRVTGLLKPVDRPDVGMVERGQYLRFALETGQPVGVCT